MSLITGYIILAIGCAVVGVVLIFVDLAVCQYLGIDISTNVWVLGIPIFLSLLLNILLVEVLRKYRKK